MEISAEAEAAIAMIVALQTEVLSAREVRERIRTFMRSDLDPETKLFGIALLFRLDDARTSGHSGVTLTTDDGTAYDCTFETFDAVMRRENWGSS
jgi:hypothetical protein